MRDQVTGMTYSDGTPAVTMSYDAAGRPLEIGNAVATDAYAYDDAGQLAVETQSVAGHPAAMRTLKYSHDAISGDPLKTLARMTARNLLSRPPQRKRSERGRASGSERVWPAIAEGAFV
jgi:YD repeat-containing protein